MVSKTVQANIGDSVNYKVIKDGYKTVTSSIPITNDMPNVTSFDLEPSSVIHNPQLNYSIDTTQDCAPIITFNDKVITPDNTKITTNRYILAPYGKDYLVLDNQQEDNFIRSGDIRIDENGFTNMSNSACMILEDRLENFDTFEIKIKIKTGSYVNTNQIYFCDKEHLSICSIALNVYDSKFAIFLSSNGSSWDIADTLKGTYTVLANTWYYVKLVYNGTNYIFSYSLDDETYTPDITVNNSTKVLGFTPCLGSWYTKGIGFIGNIDLKQVYIKINNEIWWQPTWNKLYNNYKVYGTLLIKNGITQEACTTSNYLETIPRDFSACISSSDTWEWVFKLEEYIPNSEAIQVIYTSARSHETRLCIMNDCVVFSIGNTGNSYQVNISGKTQLQQGNGYWIKVEFTGSRYNVYLSTDGVDYTLDAYADSTTPITYMSSDSWAIGYNKVNSYYYLMTSKLNLSESYIKINGKTWWSGMATDYINPKLTLNGVMYIGADYYTKGFSSSNYCSYNIDLTGYNTFEIYMRIHTIGTAPTWGAFFSNNNSTGASPFRVEGDWGLRSWCGATGSIGNTKLSGNRDYWIKGYSDGTTWYLYSKSYENESLDEIINVQDWILSTSTTASYMITNGTNNFIFGRNTDTYRDQSFNGGFYLNDLLLRKNGTVLLQGVKQVGEYLPGILDPEYIDTGNQVTLNLYDVETDDRYLVINDTRNVNIKNKKFVEYDGQMTIPSHMLSIYDESKKTWEKYKNVTLIVNNEDTTIYTEGNG